MQALLKPMSAELEKLEQGGISEASLKEFGSILSNVNAITSEVRVLKRELTSDDLKTQT